MSNQTSGLNPIEREAIDWVERLTSGEMTPEQHRAMAQWLAQGPAQQSALADAQRLWDAAGPALQDRDTRFAARLDALGRRRKMASRRAVLGGGVAVAAVAIYGVTSPPFGLWPSFAELNSDFRTATGEQRRVNFGDRVAINLNTQTSLAVRASEGIADRIELIAGEASFATAPHAARPLIVLAADGQAVADLGRFDVRHVQSAVSVTCFEGAVSIACGPDKAELQPGQRVQYDRTGLGAVAAIDTQRASDWQRGIVEFRGTPLAEAVEEINRYRPGRIIITNASLGRKQLSGRFRIDQMNEALLGLERAFGAQLKHLPGGIVLLS